MDLQKVSTLHSKPLNKLPGSAMAERAISGQRDSVELEQMIIRDLQLGDLITSRAERKDQTLLTATDALLADWINS